MLRQRFTLPEWLITGGSSFFVLALVVSAIFVPEIRGLHTAQAGLYLVAVFLSLRRQRWGYFIGASAAGFWNVLAMFGSPLFAEMIAHLQPDLVIQGLAWLANLAVIIGAAIGYRRLGVSSPRDLGRFALAFGATTGYLVAATALLAPSYLAHLGGILHPHWPWLGS